MQRPADNLGMSQPRQILPGSTYLLSRRCTQRQFLLKPSDLTTQIFMYVLAVAAENTGVLLHAVCVLSNHWHAVVTDPEGRLPEFMCYVNKYVAKAVNASLGRWENLFATEQPSAVRLERPDDVIDKMLYTLLNPVESCLVKQAEKWPGLWGFEGERTVERPAVFFRPDGPMPERVKLKFEPPPHAAGDLDFYPTFSQQLALRGKQLRAKNTLMRRIYLGKRRIMRQSVYDRPKSAEPRRKLSPRVACQHKWLRIEALGRVKAFIVAYREAYARWKKGIRDAVFPPGTYALSRYAGVNCAASP